MRRERRLFLLQFSAALSLAPLASCRSSADSMQYGTLRCYVARPRATAGNKTPVVLVLHGEHGLDAHIEGAAQRCAQAGFLAIAPDLADAGAGEARTTTLAALVDEVVARPRSGKLGAIGFSSGGTAALQLGARSEKIAAVAAYYSPLPAVLEVPRIKARVLLHFAQNDAEINTAVPAYEAALNAAGVQNAIHVYAGTAHGFADEREQADPAELAWSRTLAFLKDALQ